MSKLLVVHSLTEKKLLTALDLGGFPLPSIAVIKDTDPFTEFGRITFVVKPDRVDPQYTTNLFYDRDIFSQRFPEPEYQVDKKYFNSFYKDYSSYLTRDRQDLSFLEGMADIEYLKNKTATYVRDRLTSDRLVRLMYADRIGATPELPYIKQEFNSMLSLYEPLNSYLKTKHINLENDTTFHSLLEKSFQAINEKYRDLLGESVTDDIIKSLRDETLNDGVFNPSSIESRKLLMDRLIEDNSKKLDKDAFNRSLDAVINSNEAGFTLFVDAIFSKMFTNPHIKISGKKCDFTLENIERYMLKQKRVGVEDVMSSNLGLIAARHAKKFASFTSMIDKGESLSTSTDRDNSISQIVKTISEITQSLSEAYPSRSRFTNISEIIYDALNIQHSVGSLTSYLNKEGFDTTKINEKTIKSIMDTAVNIRMLPVSYFEGKPQKTLYFDDFAAVIVPKDTPQSLVDRFPASLKVCYYDPQKPTEKLSFFKEHSIDNYVEGLNQKKKRAYKPS